jgi:hypothetical protein
MRTFPIILLALAVVAPFAARADHPDLAGIYQLDTASSTFGSDAHPTAGTLTISQHGKMIQFAERIQLPNGEKVREFEWRTDKKYHPIDTPEGIGMGEVLARWEGDTLLGERRTDQGIESIRIFSPDASTLTEVIHRSGGPDSTLVWKRRQ